MKTPAREALLVSLPAPETEQALDGVLAERGFERAEMPPPGPDGSIARSEARFFDIDLVQPTLSLVREWTGYNDATPWAAALGLAEGLPPAARMEMALPPALSVLGRALSRRTMVLGFAMRERPWHLVGVAYRAGRAVDVITAVKDHVALGTHGHSRPSSPAETRMHLEQWLASHGVGAGTIEIVLGERALPSTWRLAYLHDT